MSVLWFHGFEREGDSLLFSIRINFKVNHSIISVSRYLACIFAFGSERLFAGCAVHPGRQAKWHQG